MDNGDPGSAGTGAAAAGTVGKEPLPPTWDGVDPTATFPVYEKNVKLWEFESELDEKKRGVRLLRSLTGVARAAADSLEFEDVATQKGVSNLMKCLKEHFAPHLEVSLPRAFEKAIYGQPRHHRETMQEYLIRMERNFYLLGKEGVNLPDTAVGYVMFRQAALTEGQELRFGAWAEGKYDKKTVVSCLRKLDKVTEGKAKSSQAFLQGDLQEDALREDLAGDEEAHGDELDGEDDQFVYLEDGDLDRVFDESEVQIVLATYQEIRKAIQNNQKGRQFYRGGKGKGSSGSDFLKGKRRVHIEQLKLRTRCAKCGTVGHWARECTSAPDQRGRQNAAAMAAGSTSKSSTSASSVGQQSWYVSSGDQSAFEKVSRCFSCWGDHFRIESGDSRGVGELPFCDGLQDEPSQNQLVRGRCDLDVFRESSDSTLNLSRQWSTCCFVGLTTSPTMAVVDTAAQDGLIGVKALERLKQQLTEFGLQIIWSDRKAKAHGIGGAAKVVGVAALPLGLAGSSGVLEATVVDNEVPLLLPVKMLRKLQAVIDVGGGCMHLKALNKTVELNHLPSGHLAVDVLDFGQSGFQHPVEAVEAGYREFRCNAGSETGCVMLTHLICPNAPKTCFDHGRPPCFVSPCLPSRGPAGRCSDGRGSGSSSAQSQAGCEELESGGRQDLGVGSLGWARGVGSLLVACGYSRDTAFNTVLKAVGRAHRSCRSAVAHQVQVEAGKELGDMPARGRQACDGGEPILELGELPRLPCQVGCTKVVDYNQEEAWQGGSDNRSWELNRCDSRRTQEGVPGFAEHREGQPCSIHEGIPCRAEEDVSPGVQHGQGDQTVEVGAERSFEDGAADKHNVELLCRDGDGKELCGEQGIPRLGDVRACGGKVEAGAGAGGASQDDSKDHVGARDDGECRADEGSRFDSCGNEEGAEQDGEGAVNLASFSEKTWVRIQGEEAGQRLKDLAENAFFNIGEIYVQEDEELYKVGSLAEVGCEENFVVGIEMRPKTAMEDAVDDVEEKSLPSSRKLKNKLRRAEKEVEAFMVDVSEIYSPPRTTKEAEKQKMKAGTAYDMLTGYELGSWKDQHRMWKELAREDPELVVLSPPCTAFSMLQQWNYPRMSLEKAVLLIEDGLHHVRVSAKVALWQHRRGKKFLFEHPLGSKAWQEPEIQELMALEDVEVCVLDQCAYGQAVDGDKLNKKPTMCLTDCSHIAAQLKRRCPGDHEHQHLLGGRAKAAAVYPPELCKSVVRGLRAHLRRKYEEPSSFPVSSEEIAEVFAARGQEEDNILHDFEDLFPEEIAEYRERKKEERKEAEREKRRIEAAVTEEDKKKVMKMHINLGHPEKASFLRFLRAGRIREEVLRWVAKEFRCQHCESHVLPKAPRPAVVPKCYKPGVAVGLDLFFIPDVMSQKAVPILNVVDLGTNYQVIEMLESKEPEVVWSGFWRTWCRVFGMPEYISIDEGREFRGAFTKWSSEMGTIVFRAAARAPWQQGKVERHGGLMKDMIEKAREASPPSTVEELKMILYECECAKNRYMNRSGYSPVQRQIGQWPRVPGSLMSDETIDPALQAHGTSDAFDKLLEIRQIAQEAFMKLTSREAAAKALKARPRLQTTFRAGELVYVYRVLRKRKTVQGHDEAARGPRAGQKATWVGPGHVLAMEGSVVWINMFGELWRASIEQTREATTMEKLGVEVVAEDFSEMQERLRRGSHRAGYRDVTGDQQPTPEDGGVEGEVKERREDEVQQEGEERGRPRARFAVEEQVGHEYDPISEEEEPPGGEDGSDYEHRRRLSVQTVGEPEAEMTEPNLQDMVDEERTLEDEAVTEAQEEQVRSVASQQTLDGVKPKYEAIRHQVQRRWERRHEAPYFAEYFLVGEDEEEEHGERTPKNDYWVYDAHRGKLQRHHVQWRKTLFNPSAAEGSPIPLRALKKHRRTRRVTETGDVEDMDDEWSLFTSKEGRSKWWKGITEFKVDQHFLQCHAEGNQKKKRGEGEVFPHEISSEEWPEWVKQDKEEFDKVVNSGGLKILSVEESRRVKEELKQQGKLNRILPSRMVRRYKPGDAPGAPRSRKSRFCLRGDRDPDAALLSRFAPTVTTSNLQVLIQAAMNKKFDGLVGDLKSAFTQSLPLTRENGPIYCKAVDGSMPGLDSEQIAEVKLGVYGLCDAPMHWRKTLVQFITNELGYRQSALDPCTYMLHGEKLHGMIAVEIDDLLMFGDDVHLRKVEELKKRFTFGKLEKLDEKGVNFNGRRLRREGDTMLIDMKAFVEERLEGVELSKERMKMRSEKVTEDEMGLIRKACGSLNWAGREGRPDAAAAASMFSSLMTEMKIEDVLELNKVIAKVKQNSDLALRIQSFPEDRMRWGVISDASWGNAKGGRPKEDIY